MRWDAIKGTYNMKFVGDDKGGLDPRNFDAISRQPSFKATLNSCEAKNIYVIAFSEGCSVVARWATNVDPGDSKAQNIRGITFIESPRWPITGFLPQMAYYLPMTLWLKGYTDIRYAWVSNYFSPVSGSSSLFWNFYTVYSPWNANHTSFMNPFEVHHPFDPLVFDAIRWTTQGKSNK